MDIITERENRLSRAHSDNGSDHGSHDDSPSASASSIGASRVATATNSSSLTASRLHSRSSNSKLKPNRRRPLRWFYKRSRELNAYVRSDGSQQQKCPNRHQDDRHSQDDSSSPHGSNSPAGGDRDVTNATSSTTTAESADASHSANEIEHLNDQNPSAGFEKVQVNRKIYREFCGVRFTQQIKAHEGPIWAMKFSCDGKYLATAGQDKTVRVWEVSEQYTAETATNGQTANGADEGEDQEKIANLLNAQHDSKTSERPFQREPYRTYTGHTVRAHTPLLCPALWSKGSIASSSSRAHFCSFQPHCLDAD
jgi:WD40 repeat protein